MDDIRSLAQGKYPWGIIINVDSSKLSVQVPSPQPYLVPEKDTDNKDIEM